MTEIIDINNFKYGVNNRYVRTKKQSRKEVIKC